jgi:uncharacterized protein YjbI with pentapeptide repeats
MHSRNTTTSKTKRGQIYLLASQPKNKTGHGRSIPTPLYIILSPKVVLAKMTDDLIQVFISYAREDVAAAKEIYEFLNEEDNIRPWLDLETLSPGADWQRSIMHAIKESRFILVLLSNNSINKRGYIQKEISEAIDQYSYFPPGKLFLIPVRLEDCEPAHDILHKLNWVDLFNGWKEGMDKIVSTIKQESLQKSSRPKELLYELVSDAESQTIAADLVSSINWLNYSGEEKKIAPNADIVNRILSKKTLSGQQLMNHDMRNLNLRDINLSGASLVGVDMSYCILNNANLKGANLERANLYMADLQKADLWGANLWGANLEMVKNLKDASLVNANVFGIEGLTNEQVIYLAEQDVVFLEDYGELVVFYKDNLGMTDSEFKSIFKWSQNNMFLKMLGVELAKKAHIDN